MNEQRETELLQLATMAIGNDENPFMNIATRFMQFMNFMLMKESIPASKFIATQAIYIFNTKFSHWIMTKDHWVFEDSFDAMMKSNQDIYLDTDENVAHLHFVYSADTKTGTIVVTEKELAQYCRIKLEFEITDGLITSLRVKDKLSSEDEK